LNQILIFISDAALDYIPTLHSGNEKNFPVISLPFELRKVSFPVLSYAK